MYICMFLVVLIPRIQWINRNKQCNSFTFSNDIALLKLSSDVSITSWVKLASLPSSGMIMPHNHPCYLTGYGRISSESEAASCTRHSGFWGLFFDTVHVCLSSVYLKPLEACRPEWDRPSFLLLTTRHAPALAGGAAPSRLTWSVQEVKPSQDVMWVCCRKYYVKAQIRLRTCCFTGRAERPQTSDWI